MAKTLQIRINGEWRDSPLVILDERVGQVVNDLVECVALRWLCDSDPYSDTLVSRDRVERLRRELVQLRNKTKGFQSLDQNRNIALREQIKSALVDDMLQLIHEAFALGAEVWIVGD